MNLTRFLVDRAIYSGGKRSVSGFPITAKSIETAGIEFSAAQFATIPHGLARQRRRR